MMVTINDAAAWSSKFPSLVAARPARFDRRCSFADRYRTVLFPLEPPNLFPKIVGRFMIYPPGAGRFQNFPWCACNPPSTFFTSATGTGRTETESKRTNHQLHAKAVVVVFVLTVALSCGTKARQTPSAASLLWCCSKAASDNVREGVVMNTRRRLRSVFSYLANR